MGQNSSREEVGGYHRRRSGGRSGDDRRPNPLDKYPVGVSQDLGHGYGYSAPPQAVPGAFGYGYAGPPPAVEYPAAYAAPPPAVDYAAHAPAVEYAAHPHAAADIPWSGARNVHIDGVFLPEVPPLVEAMKGVSHYTTPQAPANLSAFPTMLPQQSAAAHHPTVVPAGPPVRASYIPAAAPPPIVHQPTPIGAPIPIAATTTAPSYVAQAPAMPTYAPTAAATYTPTAAATYTPAAATYYSPQVIARAPSPTPAVTTEVYRAPEVYLAPNYVQASPLPSYVAPAINASYPTDIVPYREEGLKGDQPVQRAGRDRVVAEAAISRDELMASGNLLEDHAVDLGRHRPYAGRLSASSSFAGGAQPYYPEYASPGLYGGLVRDSSYREPIHAPNAEFVRDYPIGQAPLAIAGVDTNRDGYANLLYVGADRNRDGIPDALQASNFGGTYGGVRYGGVTREPSVGGARTGRIVARV